MQTNADPIKKLSNEQLIKNYLVLLDEDIQSKDEEVLSLLQNEIKKRGLDPLKQIETKE